MSQCLIMNLGNLQEKMNRYSKNRISENIVLYGLCFYAILIPFMQNPYDPVIGGVLSTGKIQLVDVILVALSPFGIYLIYNNLKLLATKFKWITLSSVAYLLVILCSVRDYSQLSNYFELVSAASLIFLFFLILITVDDFSKIQAVMRSMLLGGGLTVLASLLGLILYYFFNFKWSYVIQENHVFPYLGDVVRLTGPFKPTAKLLSSYLTLLVPLSIAYMFGLKERRLQYAILSVIIASFCIFPFTLSRGIVGFAFAVCFLFYCMRHRKPSFAWVNKTIFLLPLFLFIITFVASTIYIDQFTLQYKTNNSDHLTHTVYYYYLPGLGQEEINIKVAFARDHYYWLKKAAYELFKSNLFGVGNGGFSSAVLQLENFKIVPDGLSRHNTPQAQFFYDAAERGWLGIVALIALFSSWFIFLLRQKANIIVLAAIGSLLSLCLIDSLYLEILRFRFLWYFAGFSLAYVSVLQSLETRG